MTQKEYSISFALGAKLNGSFNSSFQKAQKTLKEAHDKVVELNKKQSDITSYQKQQESIAKTSNRLESYQKQLDNVQREMAESGKYSSELANKEEALKLKISETERALLHKNQKLQEMGQKLNKAGLDTGNLANESDKLEHELKELREEEEKAANAAAQLGDRSVNAFETIGSALVAAGIAEGIKRITQAYAECVTAAAEFEATMSTVEALSGSTSEEMAQLNAMAKELGATTKFTALESGQAMTYMGMAGWNAQQMLSGMDGVMNLAAASGEDLAMVSDIVTDNLTAFGLKASDTAHFSDVLAAAAANSNTSVGIMGETFKGSASVAGALGYSIEDVAVAVGLMANAGVKGSIANTALKNTFNGLLNGATLTAKSIGEVKVSAINADGTMKSFGDTIVELRRYFEQMTEAEKVNNAMTIAGQRGYNGLLAIVNATDEDFQSLTDSINNCQGAAKKMADIKMDNLKGQVTLMNSALDGLKTTIGEAAAPELRALAEIATEVLNGINGFLQKSPALTKALIATIGVASAGVGVYTAYNAAKKVSNTLKALNTALTAKETAATIAQTGATVAQTAVTKGATVAQNELNAAMNANPVGLIITAVAALTVGIIAATSSIEEYTYEANTLTAASQEQKEQLDELNKEYEKACELYGDTSYQAQELSWQIDDLNNEYSNSKQTLKEFYEELAATHDEYVQMNNEHMEQEKAVEKESRSIVSLAERLAVLANAQSLSTAEQQEAIAIIKALNEEIPELNLSYDKLTGKITGSGDAILEMARAEATARKQESYYNDLVEKMSELAELENAKKQAQSNVDATKQRLRDERAEYKQWLMEEQGGNGPYTTAKLYRLNWIRSIEESLNEQNKALETAEQDYKDCYQEIERYKNELEELSETEASDPVKLAEALSAVQDGYLDVATAAKYYNVNINDLQTSVAAAKQEQLNLEAAIKAVDSGYMDAAEAIKAYGLSITEAELSTAVNKERVKINNSLNAVRLGYMDTAAAANYYGVTVENLETAVEAAESYQENLEAAMKAVKNGFFDAAEAADAYGLMISGSDLSNATDIIDTAANIATLTESYNELLTKAQESISGQYRLWNDAADIVETNVWSINSSLQSQIDYWDRYNADLESLSARADNIEGLREVISSFADGSADSVNAIAGMARATDAELQQMAETWQKLKEKQSETSTSLTELQTGYSDTMNELETELQKAVDELNLKDEATQAAKDTIDAYVQALTDGTVNAENAATELAMRVANALQIKSVNAGADESADVNKGVFPSKIARNITLSAYASGTSGAEPGLALVGENGPEIVRFRGGEQVYTASETKAILGSGKEIYTSSGTQSITISPQFFINGNNSDVRDNMQDISDQIVELIEDTLRNRSIDTQRGAYL